MLELHEVQEILWDCMKDGSLESYCLDSTDDCESALEVIMERMAELSEKKARNNGLW